MYSSIYEPDEHHEASISASASRNIAVAESNSVKKSSSVNAPSEGQSEYGNSSFEDFEEDSDGADSRPTIHVERVGENYFV